MSAQNLFISTCILCTGDVMRLAFLGPPGSGKGTQAQILAKNMGIPQISSGDLLREAVQEDTPIGRKAKQYMDKGELVPDTIVVDLVSERIKNEPQFILDGFPRSLPQAEKLDDVLFQLKAPLQGVINIEVPLEDVVERLSGRLTCSQCNAIYHTKYNPPEKEGVCNLCRGHLFQRSDDTEAVITERFQTYKEQTEPLISYYREREMLINVDGTQSIEKIAAAIEEKLHRI